MRPLPRFWRASAWKRLLPLPELWAASAWKHLLPKWVEALRRYIGPVKKHLLALLLEALHLGLNPTIIACAVAAGEGLYRQNLLEAGYWLVMATTVEGLGPWAIRVLDRLLFPAPTP